MKITIKLKFTDITIVALLSGRFGPGPQFIHDVLYLFGLMTDLRLMARIGLSH